jgi:[ribosomal protein S18]-alanine N-acetyltransferase
MGRVAGPGLELLPLAGAPAGTVLSWARTVSSWAVSAEEVAAWCSYADAPVPAEVIVGWGREDDVQAFAVRAQDGVLVAYGELWIDHDEHEVELARLIVDPARRNLGIGRALAAGLAERARQTYPQVFLRVRPGNTAAVRCYTAAGFAPASAAEQEEWNRGQPVPYTWMRYAREDEDEDEDEDVDEGRTD